MKQVNPLTKTGNCWATATTWDFKHSKATSPVAAAIWIVVCEVLKTVFMAAERLFAVSVMS